VGHNQSPVRPDRNLSSFSYLTSPHSKQVSIEIGCKANLSTVYFVRSTFVSGCDQDVVAGTLRANTGREQAQQNCILTRSP
jgi:hypothetical protein